MFLLKIYNLILMLFNSSSATDISW